MTWFFRNKKLEPLFTMYPGESKTFLTFSFLCMKKNYCELVFTLVVDFDCYEKVFEFIVFLIFLQDHLMLFFWLTQLKQWEGE